MIKTINLGNGQALEAGLKAVGIAVQGADGKDKIEAAQMLANFDDENINEIMMSFSGLQLTTLLNIVWAMAKNANDNIPEPKVFYNSFDEFPSDLVIPEVVRQIINTTISKKNRVKIAARMKAMNLSASTSSQSQELTEA